MCWIQCSTVKDTKVRKSRNVFDVISISCEISVWEVGSTVKPSLSLDRPETWAEGVSLHIIKRIQRSVLTKWCQIPHPFRSNLGQGLEKREGQRERQTDRQTDRQADRQAEKDRQRERQTDRHRQTRETDRQTDTDRPERETDRQTQPDRQSTIKYCHLKERVAFVRGSTVQCVGPQNL